MNELIKQLGHLAVHHALREGPKIVGNLIEQGKREYESSRLKEEIKKRQDYSHKRWK